MEIENKYGLLLNGDIKLHRQWFKEMVKLHGINVIYRAVKPGKKWTSYAELDTNFEPPTLEGCIFDEHPTQQTLKKIGWVSEYGNKLVFDANGIAHCPFTKQSYCLKNGIVEKL